MNTATVALGVSNLIAKNKLYPHRMNTNFLYTEGVKNFMESYYRGHEIVNMIVILQNSDIEFDTMNIQRWSAYESAWSGWLNLTLRDHVGITNFQCNIRSKEYDKETHQAKLLLECDSGWYVLRLEL
jgi:hypothetical protein